MAEPTFYGNLVSPFFIVPGEGGTLGVPALYGLPSGTPSFSAPCGSLCLTYAGNIYLNTSTAGTSGTSWTELSVGGSGVATISTSGAIFTPLSGATGAVTIAAPNAVDTTTVQAVGGTKVFTGGLFATQTGLTSSQSEPYPYNNITITGDQINSSYVGTPNVAGFSVSLGFGGGNTAGAREAGSFSLIVNGAPRAGSADNDYIGVFGQCYANTSAGGSSGSPAGGLFASNFNAACLNTATYYGEICGCELDIGVFGTGSTEARFGLSALSNTEGQAYNLLYDCAVEIGTVGTVGSVAWHTGILFSSFHGGAAPVDSTGTLIGTDGAAWNIGYGIDFSAYSFLTYALKFKNFTVNGAGLVDAAGTTIGFTSGEYKLDLGGFGTTVYRQASDGSMVFTSQSGTVLCTANVVPMGDNTYLCGQSGNRWSAVWAANGTIQTSDASLKTDIAPLPSALPIVAAVNPITYRWKEGGKSKDGASIPGKRTHWGFAAHEVKAAIPEGLDFGGYVKDEAGIEHLRPDQLVPILWKAVQELTARVAALEMNNTVRNGA